MKFNIILAVDEKNGVWVHNTLAWNLPSDMKHFKNITTQTKDLAKLNAVIMWRKTWMSIPWKFKPLKNRINCILSRNLKKSDLGSPIDDFTLYFNSLEDCLIELESKENLENIYIIWWADLYNQVLNHPMLEKIYMTKVKWDFKCDVFLNEIPESFVVESYTEPEIENWIEYSFWVYKKIN
jgi:dihydrofolate reductase